jgi:nucleotidyltransferase substrate binding protein (TIGR01987 family)
MSNQDIRWKQRFQNLEKAYSQFQEALVAHLQDHENKLIRLALVQTFEFTYELCWKTLNDYLDYSGIKDIRLPRDVIKQSFQADLISDGQMWIDMLDDRNLMSHTYSEENALKAVKHICEKYQEGIRQVFETLKSKI